MCIIFIIITGFLSVSFYTNGEIFFALISGVICLILASFFIQNLIHNSGCLFGNKSNCRKDKKS